MINPGRFSELFETANTAIATNPACAMSNVFGSKSLRICYLIFLLVSHAFSHSRIVAQVAERNSPIEKLLQEQLKKGKPVNWQLPTLGGTQYWSDVRILGGWKIQRNSETKHYRLLDEKEVRQAWGKQTECEALLLAKVQDGAVRPEKGKVVILLHGLMRASDSMERLGDYLKQKGSFTPINFTYASGQSGIEVHAADLKSVIDGLDPGVTEIHFVAHSMGNIVVRHYLKDLEKSGAAADNRFKRMVMLAPPNQGSESARKLSQTTSLFHMVTGKSGLQLGVGWKKFEPSLAIPKFEFGIIIGAKAEDESFLKPHDFTVSMEESKLTGARDYHEGPYYHWDVMRQPEAMAQTLEFLKSGKFR